MVSINDVCLRSARGLEDGEVVSTGKYRWRFLRTPHVPHGWDAGLLFEETHRTLLSSDLLHQSGECEPSTEEDLLDRAHAALEAYQGGAFDHYLPYTPFTERILGNLAALEPQRIAPMHGSTYVGDGARVLRELAGLYREFFGSA